MSLIKKLKNEYPDLSYIEVGSTIVKVYRKSDEGLIVTVFSYREETDSLHYLYETEPNTNDLKDAYDTLKHVKCGIDSKDWAIEQITEVMNIINSHINEWNMSEFDATQEQTIEGFF